MMRLSSLLLYTALICALTSCSSPQQTDEPTEASEPPRYQRTIRTALGHTPETLDTVQMSGAPEGRLAVNLFEGLLVPAKTTEGAQSIEDLVEPGVAKSWEVSDDGKTYTFHLREDARWSDGEPVRTQDFVYAWKRVLTPTENADYAALLDVIEGAEAYRRGKHRDWSKVAIDAPDDLTLEVTLTHPAPYFLEMVTFYTFSPQPDHVVDQHGDDWTKPENIVTNGAYELAAAQAGGQYKLSKNAEYWDADNVAFDLAVFDVMRDRSAIVEAYERDELDFTGASFPGEIAQEYADRSDYLRSPMLGVYYLRFNVSEDDSLLADPTFRMALKLSIDREKIVAEATGGSAIPLGSYVPPGLPGYERPEGLTHAPERGASLLERAAPGELPSLEYLYNRDDGHRRVARGVQAMWQESLGIDVELAERDWRHYLQAIDLLDYEIARAGWIGDYSDPMTFLQMFETGDGNNDTGWSNAEYDALLDQTRHEPDQKKRMELLQKAEHILLTEGPVIPIYQYVAHYLVSEDIDGFEPHMRDIHLLKYMQPAE